MSEEGGRKLVPMPIKVGIGLTIILLVTVVYLASIYRCSLLESGALECRTNLLWFLDAPPNEIGDTIAGVFATLAFVWIVVTVFLQSAELAEQRRELELTRVELQLAREAQEAQLKVMQKQADIFEDEKSHRDSESAKRVLDQLIQAIAIQVQKEKDLKNNFDLAPRYQLDISSALPLALAEGRTEEQLVRSISDSLQAFQFRIMDAFGNVKPQAISRKSKSHFFYHHLRGDFDYILSLRSRLSEDQEVRLQSLGIEESSKILGQLLNADIWLHDEDRL